jgi:hypothetical protein
MKAFKNLIEFVTKRNKRFYNRDIKCPVCGETMWADDNYVSSDSDGNNVLCLACKNECCTMEIKYKNYTLWDDEI